MAVRWLLPGPTTFYVATNGSDSNDGLSATTPFLTLAHAIAVITGQIDFGSQAVTLQANPGHAAFTSPFVFTPWAGGGSFTFDLGGGSITATNTDAIYLLGDPPGLVVIQNGTLSTTGASGGQGLHHQMSGLVEFKNITFGACVQNHILLNGGGSRLDCIGNYTISGNATHHAQVVSGCTLNISAQIAPGLTVTLSGTPAFSSAFLFAVFPCLIAADGVNWSGAATGSRYLALYSGVIFTNGQGPNYLPGSTAGSAANQGQYV
jgi:hypothetical protein